MNMNIKINFPSRINESYLLQIIDLIKSGGQVNTSKEKLKEYLMRSECIAYELIDNKIICTATLKNPFNSYTTKVFNYAEAKANHSLLKELGYIVTHHDYQNKGHCSNLLKKFLQNISQIPMYATTRKPEMVHLLKKYEFIQIGKTYNNDIKLLIHYGDKYV